MIAALAHDFSKKLRFACSCLRRRLIHVNLQLLYDCNYRCGICEFWTDRFRHRPRLSAADARLIADKLDETGPKIISIGGGEAMLHPELVEIVRMLGARHFPVMITNGSLVTPELARKLFQAGMVEISVSLDYADPARHDAQRGAPGAFQQGLAALKTLQASRTHPEQRVHLIVVIMDDNLAELEPLIEHCRAMGITCLVTLYSRSRGSKGGRKPPADVSAQLLRLKRRHRHFVPLRGYIKRFSEAVSEGGIGPCYAGRNLCNIDSQGNVGFCIDRLDDVVGNILSEEMKTLEARLVQRQQTNTCRDCWTSCRGCVESLLYGQQRWLNLLDYFRITRPVALGGRF